MTEHQLQRVVAHISAAVRILEQNRGGPTVLQLRVLSMLRPALVTLLNYGPESLDRPKNLPM